MEPKDLELLLEARTRLELNDDANTSSDNQLICECMCISLSDIKVFLKNKKSDVDLELLKRELKLGSGCSSCTKSFCDWKSKL